MTDHETPFQILYVSEVAPDAGFGVVNEIVSVSRRRNPAHGITGALLFDGEHFCQLLEGPRAEVTALMQRIAIDPRHRAVTMLLEGPLEGRPRLHSWRSGYCESQQLEPFVADALVRGPVALATFLSVLEGADVE